MPERMEKIEADIGAIKTAVVRIVEVLADHSERMGGMQRTMDLARTSMESRLDRLIAVTIEERTASVERLGDIERRLKRLEERVGV